MSADFNPNIEPYKVTGSFKFWCQKVLPTVYDDSLSYYEVLCKVVNYLNDVISNVDGVHLDVLNLNTAFHQLQDYVNTYFDNLDVQNEINNKLDAMASDGTLSALVSPFVTEQVTAQIGDTVANQIGDTVAGQIGDTVAGQINGAVAEELPDAIGTQVTDWLTAHVTPISEPVVIDDTLSISGACADAKVTGDDIRALQSAIISVNSLDATQIQPTADNRFDLNDCTIGTYKVMNSSEAQYIDNAPVTDTTYRLIMLETSSPARFAQIAIVNSDTEPVIYVRVKLGSGWKAWHGMGYASDVAELKSDVDLLNELVKSKTTYNLLDVDNMTTVNSYVNVGTSSLVHSTANVKTLVLAVTAGKTYTFSRKNAGSRLVLGCGTNLWTDDDDHTLLNTVSATSHSKYGTITVPEGGNYLYVFYYRAASDADYDATIEEAMITEGDAVLEYAPHVALDVRGYMLTNEIVSDIEKGVIAYNESSANINRWTTRGMTFGVEFNLASDSPSGTRIADAYGRTSSEFDNIFPWSDMRRCNVTFANGKKSVVYEGDVGFSTSNNVFVEIPAFYVCREKIGSTERWLVSGTEKGGFELHPWFKNEDGSKAEFRYYGAYKASVSSGTVKSVTGALPYNHASDDFEDFMSSISETGYKRNDIYAVSALQYLFTIEYATRDSQYIFNGSTYNPYFGLSSPTYDLEAIISISDNQIKLAKGSQVSGNSFAFYGVGMQVYIGTTTSDGTVRNVTAITSDSDYVYITVDGASISYVEGLRCAGCAQRTGKTDSLATPSGYASGDSHVTSFRYRYIENPWGTIWEMLDGLRAQSNTWYVTTPSHYREAELTNWSALSYEYQLPASAPSTTDHSADNWVQEMGFDAEHRAIALQEKLCTDNGTIMDVTTDNGVLVRQNVTVRGDKYYCDAFYNNYDSNISVPAIGGGWDHHENAGLFCMRMLPSSTTGWLYGERLTC